MKKGVIYQYHTEIESWKNRGSILILFHSEQIAGFYKAYQNDINQILEEIQMLQKEYLEFDEHDKMVMKYDGNEGIEKGVFKEGKNIIDFEDAWIKLMEKPLAPFKVTHAMHKITAEA